MLQWALRVAPRVPKSMTWTIPLLQRQAALALDVNGYVVLLGDSLLASSISALGATPVINLAIGGQAIVDLISAQLPSFQELAAAGNVRGVVVLIGTNDVPRLMGVPGYPSETPTEFAAYLAVLYDALLAQLPADRVAVLTVPYMANASAADTIDGINALVLAAASPRDISVLDLNGLTQEPLSSPGVIRPTDTADGVHFATDGWTRILHMLETACLTW